MPKPMERLQGRAPAASLPGPPFVALPAAAALSRQDSLADLSNLSWVNALLGWVWPRANTALTEFVHEDLTSRLREALPSAFKSARFSRFTLGETPPEFGPVEVSQQSETHVEVDLDINYHGDVDVLLDAGTGGITLGVRRLKFSARMCIVLDPVLSKWPVLGAVKVFCPSLPKVSLQFTGLAAVAHYPQIEQKIQRTVDDWMRSRMVLPNHRAFLVGDPEDVSLPRTFSHVPLGVLRVRPISARNLAGVNWRALEVDSFDSDPYCLMTLGGRTARTSTVVGSSSPVWPENEPAIDFVVLHRDQQLEVEVMGEDRGGLLVPGNFTGFLGSASLTVSKIMKLWPTRSPTSGRRRAFCNLDTAQVSRDMLHVNDPVNRGIPSEVELEVEWFDLVFPRAAPTSMSSALPRGHAMVDDDFDPLLDDGGGGSLEVVAPPVADVSAAPSGSGGSAVLLLELLVGTGFPLDAVDDRAGVRWRCVATFGGEQQGDEASAVLLSRRGEACDLQEPVFQEVDIHPRLWSVVDKLAYRGYDEDNIARLAGVDVESVRAYFVAKEDFEQQQQAIWECQQSEDFRVSVQWNEVVPLLVREPDIAKFSLELVDGEDRPIGRVGPVSLRELLRSPTGDLVPRTLQLELLRSPPEPEEAAGGFAWLFPAARQTAPRYERFGAVTVSLAARLRFLRPGRGLPPRGPRRPSP